MSLKSDVVLVALVAVAAIGVAWFVKKKVEGVAAAADEYVTEYMGEVADRVNPVKVAQTGAEAFARWYEAQGSNNTTFGNDARTIFSIPRNLTNEQIDKLPLGASASRDVYQWLTGSKGNQVSDFNEWLDGLWK